MSDLEPLSHLVQAVPIKLDRDRRLICDFAALLLIEDRLGVDALDGDALTELFNSSKARTQITMLWVLLLRDDPELTIEEAAHLVGYCGFGEVHQAVLRAFVAGLPERVTPTEETDQGEAAPAAKAGG